MTDAAMLLKARRAFVIAPAGCGKTQLIASAVHIDKGHRSLILTHTHAGVDALRKRLRLLGAKASTYDIDTIAGWSLKLAASFPKTSGITTLRPTNEEWNAVYFSAINLLSINAVKMVISASFDSVYVDEYQDCSHLQHDLVLKLADILPTRILGDPLQGIFDFGGTSIVDWETQIEPYFEKLPPLTHPHRWLNGNPILGNWLLEVRHQLQTGLPVDLLQAPRDCVKYVRLPDNQSEMSKIQREICFSRNCPPGQTLLAIQTWENQCHRMALQTGGKYRSPETIECKDLFKTAKEFDTAPDGLLLAHAVFRFSCLCLTKLKPELGKTMAKIFEGCAAKIDHKHQVQIDALLEIQETGSLLTVRKALELLARLPGAKKVRYELYQEMLSSLREYETGDHSCLEEAAITIRERTRRIGRAPGKYVISRTLLVKGLEFDHAIILDADRLDRKNLYVALTRASRTLTVLSSSPILNPAK